MAVTCNTTPENFNALNLITNRDTVLLIRQPRLKVTNLSPATLDEQSLRCIPTNQKQLLIATRQEQPWS